MPVPPSPALLACLALLAPAVPVGDRTDYNAAALTPAAAPRPVAGAVVVARDHGRGVPSLMWTPRSEAPPASLSVEAAARLQLGRNAAAYGITAEVITHARTLYVHDTGRGGIIVALRPTVAGVDLVHGDVKLLLDRSRKLLAISGSPHPGAHPGAARPFRLSPEAALLVALRDLHGGVHVGPFVELAGSAAWRRYDLAAARELRFREPARVRPVYAPDGDDLIPAYVLELQTRLGERDAVYQYLLAAEDGRLLRRRDAIEHAHQYRVYADPGDLRPLDGPLSDFNPHPTGDPEDAPEGLADTALVTVEGLNTNPDGVPDPWLPAGASETFGNNADVYLDRLEVTKQPIKRRGLVTAPGVFDHTYDVTKPAVGADAQAMAALTQAFYTANWLHDWWYDSGFVEATGNAQLDNFGRGGEEGDPLLLETQNGALRNKRDNAYITTNFDGASPRMELYVFGEIDKLVDLSAQPLDQAFVATVAEFGARDFDLTAPLVAVEDGAGPSTSDACEPPINDLQGAIVLIDRGGCTDRSKIERAQAAGAIGALLANGPGSPYPTIITDSPEHAIEVTIPSLGITHATAQTLRAALADEAQTLHMEASSGLTKDIALEAMTIQHEFGHLIHRRLTTNISQTGSAMSEGWGDFLAQLMSIRAGDDLDGAFVNKNWVLLNATHYFGFRRAPYSTDVAYNALTFRHISDSAELPDTHPMNPSLSPNSGAHNAGEIWVEMMLESYVALQKLHAGDLEFDVVRRRMTDYVVSGMMFAPDDATYTEQRDALLMTSAATSEADMVAIAEGFARRGAGGCAVSPPRYSLDFEGVVEDFSTRSRPQLLAAELDDGSLSCDGDGVVDVGEVGRLELAVYNAGSGPLPAGSKLEIVDPPPGLVFADGPVLSLPELAPLQQGSVSVAVSADDGLVGPTPVALRLRLTTPDDCGEPIEQVLHAQVHADLSPSGATFDDVETGSAWTLTGEEPARVWSRVFAEDGYLWRGADLSVQTDTALTSPPLVVAADQSFTIAFDHAYRFNQWDGGVLELSEDDGVTWYDILEIGEPGYTGTVLDHRNALAGRRAFMGVSPDYPTLQTLTLPFGKRFAGQTLRVRFRVASAGGFPTTGWSLDNLRFEGITNAPFSQWLPNAAPCGVDTTAGDDPTTSGTGGESSDSAGTGESGLDSAGKPPGADAEAGCGCAADSRETGWLALALIALCKRRRRMMPAARDAQRQRSIAVHPGAVR